MQNLFDGVYYSASMEIMYSMFHTNDTFTKFISRLNPICNDDTAERKIHQNFTLV